MADKDIKPTHHYDLRESTIEASSEGARHSRAHSKSSLDPQHHPQQHTKRSTQHTQHEHKSKKEHPVVMLATGAEENLEHPVHLEHEHGHTAHYHPSR